MAILLAIIMVLSFCSCANKKPTNAGSFEDEDNFQYTFTESEQNVETDDNETSEPENSFEDDEQDEDTPTTSESDDNTSSEKEDNSSKSENNNSSKKENNNSSKKENNNSSKKENNTSSKKENNNSSKKENNNSSKENNSSMNENSTSSNTTNNVSSEPIKIEIPTIEDTRTVVACWGDSITEGMSMHSKSYPSRLQEMLGDTFKVYNAGDGGEKTATIAARQGGLKVYTTKNITFFRGKDSQLISTEKQNVFVTETNMPVVLTSLLGNGINVNDVKINGESYTLQFEDFVWSPRTFKLYLYRNGETNKSLTIPKGSEVIFNGTDISTKGGIDIYMMGANGGYNDKSEEYISQLKAMIKHHGSDKYLIIKPYWDSVSGLDEFGDHVVDFPKLAVENGLEYEGLTPTAEDESACKKNKIPPSLRYQNEADNVHLNEYGYHFLAHCIYEQGKTLGYWK